MNQAGPAVASLVARLDGMPLAIELAAAQVEALGVVPMLGRLDDRLALLTAGDRLAPSRHRSLAAMVEWSYRLLDEHQQRVFRLVSVFPGPFTLEAAEAVAGPDAGPAVLHLVDCSLLVPPQAGPDGRWRYSMLETLCAFGASLLARSGEQDAVQTALARWAVQVAGQAAAGLQTVEGEAGAARWLDAEDATMTRVLAWAMRHDTDLALRLAVALGWWWFLRGRLSSQYPLLRAAAGRAVPGSGEWCTAKFFLAWMASLLNDQVAALDHVTELRDAAAERGRCRALADGLACRSGILGGLGRYAEAAEDGRQALAVARDIAYPLAEALALGNLAGALMGTGDLDGAVRLARQAEQITAGVPGPLARLRSYHLTYALIEAGDLAAAQAVCAAALARARDAGDLWNRELALSTLVILDLEAGRLQDAAANLREALQLAARIADWAGLYNLLECCGRLFAATGRPAEAVTVCGPRPLRSCGARRGRTRPRMCAAGRGRCVRPGRRSIPSGPGRPRTAARR